MRAFTRRARLALPACGLWLLFLFACDVDLEPRVEEPTPEQDRMRLVGARAWRFLPGDDPDAALPATDISAWATPTEKTTLWSEQPDAPAGDIGWFRQTVAVSPDYPIGVVLWRAFGATELYVDGQLLATNGDIERRKNGAYVPIYAPVPPEASADGEIVVAVRIWSALHPRVDGAVSDIGVGPVQTARFGARSVRLGRWESVRGMPQLFLGMAVVAIGLVHLLIYVRRREQALLAFGLGTAGFGSWYAASAAMGMGLLPFWWVWYRFNMALQIMGWAGLYVFGHLFFRFPYRRTSIAVFAVAVISAILESTDLPVQPYPLRISTGLIAAAAVIGMLRAIWVKVPNTRTVAVGFLPVVGYGLGNTVNGLFGPWKAYSDISEHFGLVAIGLVPVAIAVALANRFSGTLEELDSTYRASFRFVPVRFLEILGRKTITEVYRGDNTSLDMTVMFCDIRGFTTLSETRTPQRNFRFINQFLETMEPAIHDHGGFVGQYLGDGFLALFPTDSSDPVRAAVAMQRSLAAFNEAQEAAGEKGIRIGIGLHSGVVMLGTIGGATRLDTGVVSDVVNTASRVEGLTKMYGAPLVISEAVVERLAPAHGWTLQELDAVVVKGRSAPLRVYEVLDGEPDDPARADKEADADRYAGALAAFRAGDIAAARDGFAGLGEGRAAIELWLQRCAWLEERGLPADWDGIVRLTVK